MCGILGLYEVSPQNPCRNFENSLDILNKRGPDDKGIEKITLQNGDIVTMGHRRLSVIDLSSAGHQPMTTEDGRFTIIYNGEVYNYMELRSMLEARGYKFRSKCDTEVVLAAYSEWGYDCFVKFNGMFAIGIWDGQKRELVLARDRIGVKPLYYYWDLKTFAFSSDLRAINNLDVFKKGVSGKAVYSYMQFGFVPAPLAIYDNTQKVLPGDYIVFKEEVLKKHKYWDMTEVYSKPQLEIDEESAVSEVERLLRQAVSRQLVSDVPIGVFLSGGIDSTLMTIFSEQTRGSKKVDTFTIGFNEKNYDEAPYAGAIARHLGIHVTERYCGPDDLLKISNHIFDVYDEPFGDSSSLPTYLMSKMARENVTVTLSGTGGDELFCGYNFYPYGRRLDNFLRIPGYLRGAMNLFFKMMPDARYRRFGEKIYSSDFIDMYYKLRYLFPLYKEVLYRDLVKEKYDLNDIVFWRTGSVLKDKKRLAIMEALDMATYVPDDLLVKEDRATMACSLEGRVPFFDNDLIEFAARLPSGMKIKNGQSKYILKKILGKYLPENLWRRPKRGFSVPISNWFRKELKTWVQERLIDNRDWPLGIINTDHVTKIVNSHIEGKCDYSDMIWSLISLREWYERFYKGKPG